MKGAYAAGDVYLDGGHATAGSWLRFPPQGLAEPVLYGSAPRRNDLMAAQAPPAVRVDPASGRLLFNTRADKASDRIEGKGYDVVREAELTSLPAFKPGAVFDADEQAKYREFNEVRQGAGVNGGYKPGLYGVTGQANVSRPNFPPGHTRWRHVVQHARTVGKRLRPLLRHCGTNHQFDS